MGLYCTSKNKQKMSNSRTWYRYLMNTLFSNFLISVDTETLAKIMLVLILNTRTTFAVRTNMFWSKVDIWNANCPRATAFISARKDVLVKVFETEHVSTWGGLDPPPPPPPLRIHAECSNNLSYQGQTFAGTCFRNTGSGGIGIFNVNC